MKENNKIVDVLNDLIRINNDRIAGYEKAVENLEPGDTLLRTLFHQLQDESQKVKEELESSVRNAGGEPATDTTASGKVYRVWMDIKATFAGDDTQSTLNACEFGEDAAQKAYSEALKESKDFPQNIRSMISEQKDLLKMSHDLIRNQRDQYEENTHKVH